MSRQRTVVSPAGRRGTPAAPPSPGRRRRRPTRHRPSPPRGSSQPKGGLVGQRRPAADPLSEHGAAAGALRDRQFGQRTAPPAAPPGVLGQEGGQQPGQVVPVVPCRLTEPGQQHVIEGRGEHQVERGERLPPVVADQGVLDRLAGRLPAVVVFPSCSFHRADARLRPGDLQLPGPVGDRRHAAQEVSGREAGRAGDIRARGHEPDVGLDLLEPVAQVAGRGEQPAEQRDGPRPQLHVGALVRVRLKDALQLGFRVGLQGDVGPVSQRGRVAECVPVVGLER